MSLILQLDLVKYKCQCGLFVNSDQLYMCKSCFVPLCATCSFDQVYVSFCTTCFENITTTEAKDNLGGCSKCFKCPICDMKLTLVSFPGPHGEQQRVVCSNCRYTHLIYGLMDENDDHYQGYKVPKTVCKDFFANLTSRVALLHKFDKEEKAHREELAVRTNRKRKSNVPTEKYNLTPAYVLRKTAMEYPPEIEVLSYLEEEELNEEQILEPVGKDSYLEIHYEDRMELPIVEPYKPLPLKSNLLKRIQRRCACNANLIYGDYNPGSINYRVKTFAMYFVPQLRLSQPCNLIKDVPQSAFFYLYNFSLYPMKIVLKPIKMDDFKYVDCQTGTIETTIAYSKDEDSVEHYRNVAAIKQHEPEISNVLFKTDHSIAIQLQVTARAQQEDNFLLLQIDYECVDTGPYMTETSRTIVGDNKTASFEILVNLGKSTLNEETANDANTEKLNLLKQSYD
uniref:Dynactin subunit 4 n=1 Tax=Panagrolaimus sp. JU765 TaxID=591449 RepID=A0AC34RIQ9_9BILA